MRRDLRGLEDLGGLNPAPDLRHAETSEVFKTSEV
jgi:hypothetical protein